MPTLSDKTILILSPQKWGKMFLSKHHYAVELARRGNTVYFLDPPEQGASDLRTSIDIAPLPHAPNLFLIRHKLYFPYALKFHALPLFHMLVRPHLNRIVKAIGKKPDIIWSFDLGHLYPLGHFKKAERRVFHPVDEPLTPAAINAAQGGDIIFSVTKEILEKYHGFDAPKRFINHGVPAEFLQNIDVKKTTSEPIRVGLSGNLVRPDMDRPTLLQIVAENPDVIFECWGSYSYNQSNIGGSDDSDTAAFIEALRSHPNVVLHGAVSSSELAKAIHRMDAFLICYDINKDQSKGTNYHKIMEYLSTGKVVISNNVTTYKDKPGLLKMTEERTDNHRLPALFKEVIGNIRQYNDTTCQETRIAFARENTYDKQLDRIAAFITELC
ncbi:MAG: hypothetical protein JST68_01550 [Bacteroidetes bacterium]|nr:hypothetical protein [Bacteroidota bacterium]